MKNDLSRKCDCKKIRELNLKTDKEKLDKDYSKCKLKITSFQNCELKSKQVEEQAHKMKTNLKIRAPSLVEYPIHWGMMLVTFSMTEAS